MYYYSIQMEDIIEKITSFAKDKTGPIYIKYLYTTFKIKSNIDVINELKNYDTYRDTIFYHAIKILLNIRPILDPDTVWELFRYNLIVNLDCFNIFNGIYKKQLRIFRPNPYDCHIKLMLENDSIIMDKYRNHTDSCFHNMYNQFIMDSLIEEIFIFLLDPKQSDFYITKKDNLNKDYVTLNNKNDIVIDINSTYIRMPGDFTDYDTDTCEKIYDDLLQLPTNYKDLLKLCKKEYDEFHYNNVIKLQELLDKEYSCSELIILLIIAEARINILINKYSNEYKEGVLLLKYFHSRYEDMLLSVLDFENITSIYKRLFEMLKYTEELVPCTDLGKLSYLSFLVFYNNNKHISKEIEIYQR